MRLRNTCVNAIAVAIVSLAVVGGCGDNNKKEIQLGVILELTGPLSRLGQRSLRGMSLAVDEVNSSGGINGRKLHLFVEDDESDPKKGLAAFQRLIDQYHVPIVLGVTGSSIVMACAPIAEQRRVILFSTGATSPLISRAGDYVFRNRLSGLDEVKAMARLAYDSLGVRRVAVLFVATDYGVGNKDVFDSLFSHYGGQVLFEQSFQQGETDFRSILAKLPKGKLDAVYIIAVGENGYILRQAKELGLNVRFLSTVGIEGPDVLAVAGDAAEGVIYTVQEFDPETDSVASVFRADYSRRYGEAPDLFSALGYDAVNLLGRVIAEHSNSPDSIKSGLYSTIGYRGASGTVAFDSNGDVRTTVMLKVIRNGQFVPLGR